MNLVATSCSTKVELNSLTDNNILDSTSLNASADDTSHVAEYDDLCC